MKLKLFLIAASAMTLASCSSDEVVKNNEDANAIKFSVVANNGSRAADYFCNAAKPKYFEVSALYDTKTYFQDEVFSAEASNFYVPFDGNYRYWPAVSESKPAEFWAYKVKADGESAIENTGFATFTWNTAGNPTITYNMEDYKNASTQHDLIYAYTSVETKPALNTAVALNFRHALSQVVFYASNENSKIYIEVENVSVCNVAKSGVLTLANTNGTTNDNFQDHNQAGNVKNEGRGTWALTYDTEGIFKCTADCAGACVVLNPTLTNLTDNANAANSHSGYGESLLVLPSKRNAWVPTANTAVAAGDASYIELSCKVRNIASTTVKDDDYYIVGSSTEYGKIAIPCAFNWEQGKKYVYNITFTKTGHGGFNPTDGKEVLVPVKFNVTVDDFGNTTEYNFNGNGAFN